MYFNVIIASLGEVAVKGPLTRRRMQKTLLANINKAFHRWGVTNFNIKIEDGRIIIENVRDLNLSIASLLHVFGIEKITPAYRFVFDSIEDLAFKISQHYREVVMGKRFRVTAKRVGTHEFTSMDIMKHVGAKLKEFGGIVDLENYEIEINVDVRGSYAYTYLKSFDGLGGLPEGTEGKILSLISGGFDSPVAAWMLMKRGGKVDYVFFNIGGEEQKRQVRNTCCLLCCLYAYNYQQVLWEVEFRWIFPLLNEVPRRLRGVYLKKAMYLAAEKIAHTNNYKAIATGESLAQVSSQTLQNLVTTETGVNIPILRPLIGMDKKDSIKKSLEIGTYNISSKSKEFCALASPHPSTSVKEHELEKFITKTKLVETLNMMIDSFAKKIFLSEICECNEIIEQRYREIKGKIYL